MSVTITLIDPGGTEYDLYYSTADYTSSWPEFPAGAGMPPLQHITSENAYTDGGRLIRIRKLPRVVDVPTNVASQSLNNVLTGLKRYYTAARVDQIGLKPCKLKVTANSKTAYLDVYLDSDPLRQDGYGRVQRLSLRFIAYDPQWYYTIEASSSLVLNASVDLSYLAQRAAGGDAATWQMIGGSAPNGQVRGFALAPSGDLYIIGSFTSIGSVSANKIAKWDGSSWSALGSGLNSDAYAICIASDGTVYVGGGFTTAGGVTVNKVAKWDGSSWSALGSGIGTGTVYSIGAAPDGIVYVGGSFSTAGGVTVDGLAKWDGSSWSVVGTPIYTGGTVWSIQIAPNGHLYIAGNFHNISGKSVNHVARWDGSSWHALGSGLQYDGLAYAAALAQDGTLYVGGSFTTASGVTVNKVAKWDGSSWSALGSGVDNGTVKCMAISKDNTLYIGGTFTSVGGKPTNDRIALWNGYRWRSVDLNLTGSPWLNCIHPDAPIIGFDTASTQSLSAYTTTITNNASPTKPIIEVDGQCTLESIFNETTGKRLWFDINIQAGEKLTIDFEKLTITSSWRGNVLFALVPGSNFVDFTLESGTNNISVFASNTSGSSALIKWRNRFDTLAEAIG